MDLTYVLMPLKFSHGILFHITSRLSMRFATASHTTANELQEGFKSAFMGWNWSSVIRALA
jgi:hypothetical protein